MEYRINKRTGNRISEIGFGSAYIYEAGNKTASEIESWGCRAPVSRHAPTTCGLCGAVPEPHHRITTYRKHTAMEEIEAEMSAIEEQLLL